MTNDTDRRDDPAEPLVPTERPNRAAAERPPHAPAINRAGFDLGGAVNPGPGQSSTVGSGSIEPGTTPGGPLGSVTDGTTDGYGRAAGLAKPGRALPNERQGDSRMPSGATDDLVPPASKGESEGR